MTEQVKRGLSPLFWLLVVLVFAAGFFAGVKYEERKVAAKMTQPLGDCMARDTTTVLASNVTYEQCQALCTTGGCPWVAHTAQ